MDAGPGFAPGTGAYETPMLLLHYPAIRACTYTTRESQKIQEPVLAFLPPALINQSHQPIAF